MANIFSHFSMKKGKHSTFNKSHDRKFSLRMGELVPIMVEEVLPNDTYTVNASQMLRMMPMLAPIMHEVNVFTHFFFVPNRIMWPKWEEFITEGGQADPSLQSILFPTTPLRATSGTLTSDYRLADYLGLPVNAKDSSENVPNFPVSVLPFKAYEMIYNEYYRDENIIEALEMEIIEGSSVYRPDFFKMKRRAWSHDYFTSALPWAQKGNPVRLPLGGEAQIKFRNEFDPVKVYTNAGAPITNVDGFKTDSNGYLQANNNQQVNLDNSADLYADLEEATATTVNDLRRAMALQRWLEKNARGGTRLVEMLLMHFGQRSSDARLQRPEFLGGGMSPIMVSEVIQNSETQNTPQGNMAGHGINLSSQHGFKRHFEEHGYIIGIMSVMPKPAYQQGVPKHFIRHDALDFYWPDFQHIGEQEIKMKEIYAESSEPDGTFGYIPRYSEYKFSSSTVHGYLKTSLDFWHLGRKFDTEPTLSKEFIECNPSNRIFAVEDPDEDQLICHTYFNVKAKRLMAYQPSPTIR